jgi:hypothetical protein
VARRRRRWLITLVVLVVVLAGLFVAADRVAVNVAEERMADQAVAEMGNRDITSASRPKVVISGFPFLTQVLAGKYAKVTIDVDHPKNGEVSLDRLVISANRVHAPLKTVTSRQGQVTSDAVRGTATMSWDAVRSLIDTTQLRQIPNLDISKLAVTVKDNKVNLSAPITILGLSITLQASGTLAVAAGEVRVNIEDVRSVSDNGATTAIPKSLLDQYRRQFNVRIAVPQLPYALAINRVETSAGGVTLTATAANVVLAGQS